MLRQCYIGGWAALRHGIHTTHSIPPTCACDGWCSVPTCACDGWCSVPTATLALCCLTCFHDAGECACVPTRLCAACATGAGETGWDVFSLSYSLGPPLNSVFTPAAQAAYARLGRLLWLLARTERSLGAAWHTLKVGGVLVPVQCAVQCLVQCSAVCRAVPSAVQCGMHTACIGCAFCIRCHHQAVEQREQTGQPRCHHYAGGGGAVAGALGRRDVCTTHGRAAARMP